MNNNDAIIARIKGVPAQKETLESKFDPRNPNKLEANDNDPRRDCPWKCYPDDPKCLCAHPNGDR